MPSSSRLISLNPRSSIDSNRRTWNVHLQLRMDQRPCHSRFQSDPSDSDTSRPHLPCTDGRVVLSPNHDWSPPVGFITIINFLINGRCTSPVVPTGVVHGRVGLECYRRQTTRTEMSEEASDCSRGVMTYTRTAIPVERVIRTMSLAEMEQRPISVALLKSELTNESTLDHSFKQVE
jgi:hypothetical protein